MHRPHNNIDIIVSSLAIARKPHQNRMGLEMGHWGTSSSANSIIQSRHYPCYYYYYVRNQFLTHSLLPGLCYLLLLLLYISPYWPFIPFLLDGSPEITIAHLLGLHSPTTFHRRHVSLPVIICPSSGPLIWDGWVDGGTKWIPNNREPIDHRIKTIIFSVELLLNISPFFFVLHLVGLE